MSVQFFYLFIFFFCSVYISGGDHSLDLVEEERAYLSAFRTFVRFALVWLCLFPLPLGVWERLLFVIVAPWIFLLPLFFSCNSTDNFCDFQFSHCAGFLLYKRWKKNFKNLK